MVGILRKMEGQVEGHNKFYPKANATRAEAAKLILTVIE